MLTAEQNRRITETGPATPCGALMRRYWQPAALVEELDTTRPIRRVRLLGEDLVLFRDPSGRYGLLDRRCAHRFGRNTFAIVAVAVRGGPIDVADTAGEAGETERETQREDAVHATGEVQRMYRR